MITLTEIKGTEVHGTEEPIGSVTDLFIDQQQWSLRYFVVDTGNWFPGRKILISPSVITGRNRNEPTVNVQLTHQQVESGPDIDLMKPVSRQMEVELAKHYDWPAYWALGAGVGMQNATTAVPPSTLVPEDQQHQIEEDLPNFRSADEMNGYHISASDGEIGHVEDFIVDDQEWVVRYLVVDTRNWLPGRKVLVSPRWIHSVSWVDRAVSVDLTRNAIEESPEYDSHQSVDRKYEDRLFDYYGRAKYWAP